jgi:hypothetical protein
MVRTAVSWRSGEKGCEVLNLSRIPLLMALSQETWMDLLVTSLIAIVVIEVVSEELLGWFLIKPIGGILTLGVLGVLGYLYFSN